MLMMEDRTLALARAVRARRQALGLSLDELSARAAVSKGAIVSLENGEANPTFGTIVRVADALQTPVSALFEVAEATPVRVISPETQPCLWRGPQGGCARLLLTVPGAAPVEYWTWVLHPGEEYASHPHPPGVQEVITVTSGSLWLTVGDAQWEIPAGALVLFGADQAHSYAAVGEPCEFQMQVHLPAAHGLGLAARRHGEAVKETTPS